MVEGRDAIVLGVVEKELRLMVVGDFGLESLALLRWELRRPSLELAVVVMRDRRTLSDMKRGAVEERSEEGKEQFKTYRSVLTETFPLRPGVDFIDLRTHSQME
jgi:hypothetical protein